MQVGHFYFSVHRSVRHLSVLLCTPTKFLCFYSPPPCIVFLALLRHLQQLRSKATDGCTSDDLLRSKKAGLTLNPEQRTRLLELSVMSGKAVFLRNKIRHARQMDKTNRAVVTSESEEGETRDRKENPPFHGGVYVLANRDNQQTYVGCAGTSFWHRLRQHNREITGGASATRTSRTWYHRFLVTGFKDRRQALSFEWYVKRYRHFARGSWRKAHRANPIARRRRQIELLFQKFGATKFPGLTLHDIHSPPCYDCCNKGRQGGTIGRRLRKITPSQKQKNKGTNTTKTRFNACTRCRDVEQQEPSDGQSESEESEGSEEPEESEEPEGC